MAARKKKVQPPTEWVCRCGFRCMGSEKRCPNCLTDRPDPNAPKELSDWEKMQQLLDAQAKRINAIASLVNQLVQALPRDVQIRLVLALNNKKKG
jgi:hypothetical protein